MKRYINYILCSILLCFPYLVLGKVTCSSGDYSATIDIDKTEISINEKANITITSDFQYEIEYEDYDKSIIQIDNSVITPIKSGSTKINATIEFITEENKVECTSVLNVNVLSNNSSLKSLNLEELDISSVFRSDLYEYEVKLPYSFEKINIVAEANDENTTITGDGRRYLNEGTNDYEVIVKATDGTTSTYTIKIIREDANDDNTLKNLIVEGYVITPKFDKDVYEYSLNVDKNVEDITINALATYDLAKILGTGNYKLATGENTFYITVIAENNTEQKYTLVVNKNKGNSKLENIEIKGYDLDKKFSSDDYIYSITVNSDVEKLDINAIAVDNAQIEILGNEELKVGENNVIIRVSDEDKGTTTYKIIVNKLTGEEQKIIEQNNRLLKILFIIFVVSIIIMITVIGIFLKKNYKFKNKRQIKNLNKKRKTKK